MSTSTMSRRNSVVTNASSLSRRGSCDSDISLPYSVGLKRGRPVGLVKITFMGKTMEVLVPMNEDINIYDGSSIEGSKEARSKNSWVEIFNMMDLAINNLTQQNKELKRTVNELGSKVNKMLFHERKETSPASDRKTTADSTQSIQVQEVNKRVDRKIEKVEENILQWIDEEAKAIRSTVERDLGSLREEVDSKNIEMLSKVQTQIADLKEEVAEQVSCLDNKITESIFAGEPTADDRAAVEPAGAVSSAVTNRQILELKERIHRNSNLLRFLISEPLSVQFSIWRRQEVAVGRGDGRRCLNFNWVSHNAGGAVDDDGISEIDRVTVPISGTYLLALGCTNMSHGGGGGGGLELRRNKDRLMAGGRCDIVELTEDDILCVWMDEGTRVKEVNLMGVMLRPRIFILPGTTM